MEVMHLGFTLMIFSISFEGRVPFVDNFAVLNHVDCNVLSIKASTSRSTFVMSHSILKYLFAEFVTAGIFNNSYCIVQFIKLEKMIYELFPA